MPSIALSRLPELQTRLVEINKKAIKRGIPAFELSQGDITQKELTLPTTVGVGTYFVDFIDVEIKGSLPPLAGYRWLGAIKKMEGIFQFYGDVPKHYRDNDLSYCDHCKSRRERNNVTIVEEVTTGNTLLIGSTCHHDFFGEINGETILAFGTFMSELTRSFDEEDGLDEGWNGAQLRVYCVHRFLAIASELISQCGYISRDKAEVERKPTTGESAKALYAKWKMVDVHWQKAKSVIEYFSNLDSRQCSNYELNLKNILETKTITSRFANIAASAIQAYERAHRVNNSAESQYVGEVKKRQDFALIFKYMTSSDSVYGLKRYYHFEDIHGNQLVWKTTSQIKVEIEVTGVDDDGEYRYTESYRPMPGDKIALKATVADHKEYKGTKNTYLNRCNIISIGKFAA